MEGQRASTDHTYHVASNLGAKGEDGSFVGLKASLTLRMGQSHVLGCKASQTLSTLPLPNSALRLSTCLERVSRVQSLATLLNTHPCLLCTPITTIPKLPMRHC